jgi:hypothetical protein
MSMLTTRKSMDIAGMGPVDDHAQKQAAASKAWLEFIKVAKFRVGGQARIAGRIVTISDLQPLTGGALHVEGTYPGGTVNGNYRPGDLETV